MTSKVSSKGRIVIAKDIRKRLGIKTGWLALQRIEDDHLVVHFLPPEHDCSLIGILAPYIDENVKRSLAEKDWHEITEAAWEVAARERVARMKEAEVSVEAESEPPD